MANEEHLTILKQGTDVWNKWRIENPEIKPDLRRAKLSRAALSKANLSEANLSGARLRNANLRKANLTKADLRKANLQEADLNDAELSKLNFTGAILTGASLQGANLTEATLDKTVLSGANLTKAVLIDAKLKGAYLLGAALISADLNLAKLMYANLSRAKLNEADLTGSWLQHAIFFEANLEGANLMYAILDESNFDLATLDRANLFGAIASHATFICASLRGTNLNEADLRDTKLDRTILVKANIQDADLRGATLIKTDLRWANLTGCKIYGISAWGLKLHGAKQEDFIITPLDEPTVTADNLEVAQFIYLLLNNEKIRDVIDAITSKVVLILGRFKPERKAILDAIRNELREHKYSPVLFDFDKPASRDITETISILARMARFVIVDITEPRSVPQELMSFIPDSPSVPVQPLLLASAEEYGMFEHFKKYPWVLPIHRYKDLDDLLKSLPEKVIAPTEAKAMELQKEMTA